MLRFVRFFSNRAFSGAKQSIFKSPAFNQNKQGLGKMDAATTASNNLAGPSIKGKPSPSSTNAALQQAKRSKGKAKVRGGRAEQNQVSPSTTTKLRGFDKDPPEVRISKTLSWLLRHGAQNEGLAIRKDGYVKVVDLLEHPKLKYQGLNLDMIQAIVKADSKQRYDLILESSDGMKLGVVSPGATSHLSEEGSTSSPVNSSEELVVEASSSGEITNDKKDAIWLIKARQGHSIKTIELELKPIRSDSDIPTRIAVHGTNRKAWDIIAKEGLSKMKRNHIHLAQNVVGEGVISGMRHSAKILIYIDVRKALDAGIEFWFSENGVVLTEGDQRGILTQKFFRKVVDVSTGKELEGWQVE